jgi:hypothetical protein
LLWTVISITFRALQLGTRLNRPDAELITAAVEAVTPPQYREDIELITEALKLAARAQRGEGIGRALLTSGVAGPGLVPRDIEVASKIGAAAISGLTLVATSAAADTGGDCIASGAAQLCRWGDYAEATPDPASPVVATDGRSGGTSMLAAAGGSASTSGWTTPEDFGCTSSD